MNFSSRQVITSRQLMYLLCIAVFPTEVMLLPGPMIMQFGKDTLWAIALGGIYSAAPLMLSLYILRRSRGRSITDVLRTSLGVFGRIVILAFGLVILVATMNIWGGYVQLLHTALLTRTPPWALLFLALAVVLYGVTGGMEVSGRLAEAFVPLGVIAIVAIWLLSAHWFDVGRLLPLWPQHPDVFTFGGFKAATFLSEVLFGSYVGAFAKDQEGVPRALWLALIINTSVMLLVTSLPLLMFSIEHARILTLPPLTAVRAVNYGFTIERLDLAITPIWVIFVSLKLILWGLIGGNMVADALGLRRYALVGQIALTATALMSLQLHSLLQVEQSVVTTWDYFGFPVIIFSVTLAAVICRMRPKRVASHA